MFLLTACEWDNLQALSFMSDDLIQIRSAYGNLFRTQVSNGSSFNKSLKSSGRSLRTPCDKLRIWLEKS